MYKRLAHGLALVFLIVSFGAAQGPNRSRSSQDLATPQNAPSSLSQNSPVKRKPYQVGTASWYGEDFQGKQTASGEPYNMFDLTAAHPTLPLGSLVKVTNLRNGRVVFVRVNDRGPIVPGRIIDVSFGAAQVLHFKSKGLQRVRLDLVKPQTEPVLMARTLAP
jgi:rare lipoprotein A